MRSAWTGPQPWITLLALAGTPALLALKVLLNASWKVKSLVLAYLTLVGHLNKIWSVILQGTLVGHLKSVM